MKNLVLVIIGFIFLPFYACNSFLEEYSQDLARVETVSDLDELLLGGVYYPAGYSYIQNSTLYGGRAVQCFYTFHVRRVSAK